jgi:hypothetical protein
LRIAFSLGLAMLLSRQTVGGDCALGHLTHGHVDHRVSIIWSS